MSSPPRGPTEPSARNACLRAVDRSRVRTCLQRSLIHELRSPLNAASLYLDLVGRFLGQEEATREDRWRQLEHVEKVRSELRRVTDMLPGLLPLPEAGAGRAEAIDLVETLPRLLRLMHQRRKTLPGIRIHQDVPQGAHHTVSIDDGVEHAFLSVVLNALEAMPDGGTLSLGVRRHQEELQWEVEDDGPGIAPGLGESIFDPYVSTKEGHAGLGLFVAKLLLEEHGGTIRVTPRETGGTCVRASLPSVDPAAPPPSREGNACRTPS